MLTNTAGSWMDFDFFLLFLRILFQQETFWRVLNNFKLFIDNSFLNVLYSKGNWLFFLSFL